MLESSRPWITSFVDDDVTYIKTPRPLSFIAGRTGTREMPGRLDQ